jgi:hypothetical protein
LLFKKKRKEKKGGSFFSLTLMGENKLYELVKRKEL